MNNTAKIIMGVAIGAAAGVALGIFLAPAKGSKTRRRIAREARDIFDKMEENIIERAESFAHT